MAGVAAIENASGQVVAYDDVVRWIRTFAAEVEANKEYLTQLDAAIGDADHGINMQRGMAAVRGMQDTIPLVARKGRASYLGERSAGHQDPGATSSHLLLKTAADTWSGPEQAG